MDIRSAEFAVLVSRITDVTLREIDQRTTGIQCVMGITSRGGGQVPAGGLTGVAVIAVSEGLETIKVTGRRGCGILREIHGPAIENVIATLLPAADEEAWKNPDWSAGTEVRVADVERACIRR